MLNTLENNTTATEGAFFSSDENKTIEHSWLYFLVFMSMKASTAMKAHLFLTCANQNENVVEIQNFRCKTLGANLRAHIKEGISLSVAD